MTEQELIPSRYRIREELHRTARSIRWNAEDTLTKARVVLELAGDGVLRQRRPIDKMRREVEARAKIQHPGVQRLLHCEPLADDRLLLVLEPVDRAVGSLAEALEQRATLPWAEVAAIGAALGEAAQAVHATGFVHQAIDSSNVLVDGARDFVALTGFSYAKEIAADPSTMYVVSATANTPDPLAGLPQHRAPELDNGVSADARSDVFAIGSVLYRALTGRDASGPVGFIDGGPVDPRSLVADLPASIVDIVMRCLSPSPQARWSTALELSEALRAAADAESRQRDPQRRSRRRGVAKLAWIGVGLLALGGGAWAALGTDSSSGRAAARAGGGGSAPAPVIEGLPNYTRSRALLIGCSEYLEDSRWPPLPTIESDVLRLEDALASLGWNEIETLVGAQASEERIRDAVAALSKGGSAANERILVYYAGHCEAVQGSSFLIPTDGRRSSGNGWDKTWISTDALARIGRGPTRHLLVLLDCCNAGVHSVGATAQFSPDQSVWMSGECKLALAPTTQGEVTPAKSPFTRELLAWLDGIQTGHRRTDRDLVQHLRKKPSTSPDQYWLAENRGGRFMFYR